MAEASDAPSVVVDAVVYLARSVWSVQWGWYLARAARLAGLPLALVTVPLSWAADALLVVFAPLLYAVGLLAASAQALVSLLVSLKPLYSFLSAAAGIGIVAGVLLGATSSAVTSYLGMNDPEDEDDRGDYADYADYDDYDEYDEDASAYDYEGAYQKHLRGSDSDTGPRRRFARGLLSQTIHEEDDSSGA